MFDLLFCGWKNNKCLLQHKFFIADAIPEVIALHALTSFPLASMKQE